MECKIQENKSECCSSSGEECCERLKQNKSECACTYGHCPRKGICCECIRYHKKRGELPGCFFSAEAEKTYDRSIRKFIEDQS